MFCKHVKGFTQFSGKLTLQKIYHNPIFLIFQALNTQKCEWQRKLNHAFVQRKFLTSQNSRSPRIIRIIFRPNAVHTSFMCAVTRLTELLLSTAPTVESEIGFRTTNPINTKWALIHYILKFTILWGYLTFFVTTCKQVGHEKFAVCQEIVT